MPAPVSSPPNRSEPRLKRGKGEAAPQVEADALPRPSRFGRIGRILLLLAVVAAAFYPVLGHEFLEWDDHIGIYTNPDFLPPRLSTLGHYWTGAHLNFYVPVTYTTLWLLAHVAVGTGPDGAYVLAPWPYHAANFLAHAAGAVLLYLVLARLVRREWPAWAGAALFAVHPLHVEPVSWATSLYTPMSGAFALAAAWAYLRFSDAFFGPTDAGESTAAALGPERRRAWGRYAAVVLFYGLALLTKPTTILLPVILWAIEVVLRRRRRWGVVTTLLGALLLVGALPIAIATQNAQPATGVYSPPVLRPLIAADALAFYLQKIVLPVNLAPDYGRSPRWLMNEGSRFMFMTWLVPFAVFAAAAVAWRRTRWPAVACAAFVLALLPMLGLTPFDYQRYSTVADRYAYFALVAPAMLVAAGLAWRPNRWAFGAAGAAVIALAAASNTLSRNWHDTDRFYDYAAARNPDSFAAHTRAIRVLERSGRRDEALPHYEAAVKAYPDSQRLWHEMGRIHVRRKEWPQAIDCFARAAELEPDNAGILCSLGVALAAGGRGGEAVPVIQRALQLAPGDAATHLDAASVYGTIGQFDAARHHFQLVIRLNGDVAAAQRGLAVLDAMRQKG